MFKGIDIRYATRPMADDRALLDLRQQLRLEEQRHKDLQFKLDFLGERLQAALDAGRADNAMEAAMLFARIKEDLGLRFATIIDLNREIAAMDPTPKAKSLVQPAPRDAQEDDALIARVLARIDAITHPTPQPC